MAHAPRPGFPWRLGATSYVVPADLTTNVRLLAGKVDDVQLLFFESGVNARLAHGPDIAELQRLAIEHGLTYTVHLPSDLRPGSGDPALRRQCVDEVLRLVALLEGLAPLCYDLHLPREALPDSRWLDNLDRSLTDLAEGLGGLTGKVAVENLEYPFDMVRSLLRAHGFRVCLDVGHLLHYGHDWQAALVEDLPHAAHVHFHGVRDGKDHRAITTEQESIAVRLGDELVRQRYSGVVTLELYDIEQLSASLTTLRRVWAMHKRGRKNDCG